jgi:hypothetical protein
MNTHDSWKIEPVVLSDAPGLARTNMAAFWEDPVWRHSWDDSITLDYLIKQQSDKIPVELLHRRDILRHIKAVNSATGELVGYVRIALPVEHATSADGSPTWLELQVDDVNENERTRIQEASQKAWYEPKSNASDDKVFEMQKKILSGGVYISTCN